MGWMVMRLTVVSAVRTGIVPFLWGWAMALSLDGSHPSNRIKKGAPGGAPLAGTEESYYTGEDRLHNR